MQRPVTGLLSLLFTATTGSLLAAPLQPQDEWMGVYLLGQKMGYTHTSVGPGTGKGPALRIVSDTVIRTALLGQALEQKINYTQEATPDGKPLTLEMKMSSAGRDTLVRARYEPTVVRCSVSSGGSVTHKDVPIPKGVSLSLDPQLLGTDSLPLGKTITTHYFNPANLSIEKSTTTATRSEALTLNGIDYPATVLVTRTPMGDMTAWADKDGNTLKVVAHMGLTMLRETKETALSLPDKKYAPPADLAKALAVDSGRKLDDPRQASRLKIRLASPDLDLPVSDERQTVKWLDKDTADLTVTAAPVSPKGALSLAQAAKKQPEWVKPAPYLQSDNAEVKALAKKTLGGETNAFWAAMKLRDWVHAHMKVRADIGIIRSGLDVLKKKEGVCRDFAVLYATLARATGIPTRIATGLVYSDGAFYYHAWAESFVGPGWIDVDPTLPTAFVDATHLKLAHGGAETMFSGGKVMGRLKAQVLDYKTLDD